MSCSGLAPCKSLLSSPSPSNFPFEKPYCKGFLEGGTVPGGTQLTSPFGIIVYPQGHCNIASINFKQVPSSSESLPVQKPHPLRCIKQHNRHQQLGTNFRGTSGPRLTLIELVIELVGSFSGSSTGVPASAACLYL